MDTDISIESTAETRAQALVAAVRAAAARHGSAWEALVPDAHSFNPGAEPLEEQAFQDMADAKRALRDNICETYGISIRELHSLATI